MLWTMLACVGGTTPDDGYTESATDSAPPTTAAPAPQPYSGGECPAFEHGRNTFTSAGKEREFLMKLPDDPYGAPVWFNWHWLGGDAAGGMQYQDLNDVKNAGWIVVAPEALSNQAATEWAFMDSMDPTKDLTLFDDLISCLDAQFDIDNDRVYTTGMSAGGLWSTFLAMHRSEYLAAAAPLSGGTGQFMSYSTPERDLPVLLTWGGEDDLYSGLSFHDASLEFREDLQADGHWVGACVHDNGHNLPQGGTAYTLQFFTDHVYGADVVGFNGESVYPDWCSE